MITEHEKISRLRIIRSEKIGAATFWNLLDLYGSAERALSAIPVLAKAGGNCAYKLCPLKVIEDELEACRKFGARLIFIEDHFYPPQLRAIQYPPPVLTMLFADQERAKKLLSSPILAVVGARNASVSAQKFCYSICNELSQSGISIVSGMARGIDKAAHQGSIDNGTIAVLAGGVDNIYPYEHRDLYKKISQCGVIISEMPFGTTPQPNLFPRRNKIIAGTANGTLVIEAAIQSGSLITANMAAECGREVFAVPGFPLDPRAEGSNLLIKQGAILVEKVDDILQNLSHVGFKEEDNTNLCKTDVIPITKNTRNITKKILSALSNVPITIDDLISYVKVSPKEVLIVLIELELAGKIVRLHGQRVCLAVV